MRYGAGIGHAQQFTQLLQRTDQVTLLLSGTGCEMQVVSNYSGWEHNDQGAFKKRVNDALLKLQMPEPAEPTKPADATK